MKIIIVGDGQMGYCPASLLIERGYKATIIEVKNNRIEVLKRSLPYGATPRGNGAELKALEAADIRQANIVTVVTNLDGNNLVVGTLARLEYDVHRVIDRVNNPKNTRLPTPLMGVDTVVNQTDLMAHLVAEEMSMGGMMTLLKLHDGKYSLVERIAGPGSSVQSKLLRDTELPAEYVLVMITRNPDLLVPRGEVMLQSGDKVVMIVHIDQLENIEKILDADM